MPPRSRLLVLALPLLALAGCEPLKNAPPGGGETVTKTFRIGPFTLGPGQEIEASPTSGMPRPTGAFGLKGARFSVVDANGAAVSAHDVHLHHIVMTTSARQDMFCNRRERFIGAGMERTPISLFGPYAYLVGAGDQWGAIYHLMNETPTGTAPKKVYIQYELDVQPGANATNSRPVQPLFMDITGCGDSTYDLPGTGGTHTRSRTWTAPRNGMAVFAGGHLHDPGIDISITDTTAGTTLCTGTASYHENPRHLASINGCMGHAKVTAGNQFRVTARYENDEPVHDVMGIMLTYVWWGTQ
jgi:hypothetical protein